MYRLWGYSNRGITRTITAVIIIVVLLVVAAGAYFVLLPSTPSVSTTTSAVPYGQTLIVDSMQGEPIGLDAACCDNTPDYEIQQNIYQGLIAYSGNRTAGWNGNYTGKLATSWTISEDAKTYTFSLRQNVLFSNGKPFNAYEVWFNYYRYTLNNGPPAFVLGPTSSGGPFDPGPVTLDDLNTFNFTAPTPSQLSLMSEPNQSIQVIDEYTIAFHLEHSLGSFMGRLAAPEGSIEEASFIQANGGVQGNGTTNNYVSGHGAPGTGPYVVSSWVHGQSVTLVLNPDYWGPTPHVSKVVIQYKTNNVDAINDLKSGAAQLMYTLPINQLSSVENDSSIVLESSRSLTYIIDYIAFNTQTYPLNITKVRQAIVYAIDRNAIIDSVMHGYGVMYQGPIPLGMFGYNDSIQPLEYNLAKAKELLTEAGFPNGNGIRPLNLMYVLQSPTVIPLACQIVIADLAKIGITVTLWGVDTATDYNILTAMPRPSNYPDMVYVDWTPDYPYPDDNALLFEQGGNPYNFANINDTRINQLISEVSAASSLAVQAQLYSQITELDKQLSPYIWVWQTRGGRLGVPAWTSTVQNVTYGNLVVPSGFNYSTMYVQSTASPALVLWVAALLPSGLVNALLAIGAVWWPVYKRRANGTSSSIASDLPFLC